MIKKPILYVDMDDTICDYKGAFTRDINKFSNNKFPQSRWGFFANLEPIEGAIETLHELMEDFDVWILTRPSYLNPLSYTEKRIWVEKYFGIEFCKKLILCSDKSLLRGDYLVDDSSLCGQPEFEGEWIQYGVENYDTWEKVKTYLILDNLFRNKLKP